MKEIQTSLAGISVFWRARPADYDLLCKNLREGGFTNVKVERKSEREALRNALKTIYKERRRVFLRPLGTGVVGYSVVYESVNEDGKRLSHDPDLYVYIDQTTGVPILEGKRFENMSAENQLNVQSWIASEFSKQRKYVSGTKITALLAKYLDQLNGTPLPNGGGGLYWLNHDRIEEWTRLALCVEQSSLSKEPGREICIYSIRANMDDPGALRAVVDGLTNNVNNRINNIKTEVISDEVGSRRLKTLGRDASNLRDRVQEYENVLGVTLTDLRKLASTAARTAASAAMQSMGGN